MLSECLLRVVKKAFPIVTWGKNYKCDTAIGDLIAGITVGLTLIPQSLAYASLAGLDPEVSIFCQSDLVKLFEF